MQSLRTGKLGQLYFTKYFLEDKWSSAVFAFMGPSFEQENLFSILSAVFSASDFPCSEKCLCLQRILSYLHYISKLFFSIDSMMQAITSGNCQCNVWI